jgi:hypothetical protein
VDFTREPVIETVITPKEGSKLVLRNSKNGSQEEYFVDAIEVVSFGASFFFRSIERPKSFLVPVSDYEVLEVRETRMVLKNVGIDRSIKIGGGKDRDAGRSPAKDSSEKGTSPKSADEPKIEKKRERRRHARRRRGGREDKEELSAVEETAVEDVPSRKAPRLKGRDRSDEGTEAPVQDEAAVAAEEDTGLSLEDQLGFSSPVFSSLLPPPPKLISETLSQYRDNDLFKDAFYEAEAAGDEVAGESKESEASEAEPKPRSGRRRSRRGQKASSSETGEEADVGVALEEAEQEPAAEASSDGSREEEVELKEVASVSDEPAAEAQVQEDIQPVTAELCEAESAADTREDPQ